MPFETPLYPTNAFRFLDDPQFPSYPAPKPTLHAHQDLPKSISSSAWLQPPIPARCRLQINIVGAGLAGLATAITLTLSGHKVTVFEQAPAFGEVGAGIQVPPNSTRYLLAWGVGPHLEPHISEPEAIRLRRWQNGELIGMTRLRGNTGNPGFREKFGAPYFVVHRADYHGALVARCKELNIDIREGSEVVSYEFRDAASPSATHSTRGKNLADGPSQLSNPEPAAVLLLKNGTSHPADLIIAADGLKSPARTAILHSHNLSPISPQPTAQAAYRATIPLSNLQSHPTTTWITETPNQNLWIGPSRHCMTYSIGGPSNPNRVFNLVLSHPEPNPPETWSTDPGSVRTEMKSHFAGWDTRFLSVLDRLSDSSSGRVVKWPIMTIPPLPTWTHASSRLLVIGDAAHAMVPYMSQGAAIAVEDAAAVSAVLAQVEDTIKIADALRVFERVRMRRARGMQQASWLNGEIWHLEDGQAQRARDQGMGGDVEEEGDALMDWNANQWSDPVCQAWTYGYDAVKEVVREWDEWKQQQEKKT
ncbi:hypothetical protein H2198_000919 [Neophaeococcomyces mojaviensis]|uniref:Uncharacterized protein n=1 Tax=Neophaeococcomyces mojaviensis TaxID=3383035 RepID=A0ACC3AIT5_9EURO|nr:hypothetical protein H2198_000919 [Knufia sp. JES_112]